MLHLSLLRLPRDHPRWRHLDAYQAHQLIWRAFPDTPKGERPFLFSLDARSGPTGDVQSLLVQSTREADWAALGEPADIRTKQTPAEAPTGSRMTFALRANPTVARRGFSDGVTRRVAVGLSPERAFAQMGRTGDHPTDPAEVAAWRGAELRAWLDRQAERSGFEVEHAEAGPVVRRQLARSRDRRGAPMTLHEVEFTGVLRVSDASAFAKARASGIGRARAFGYGLLMVRPA